MLGLPRLSALLFGLRLPLLRFLLLFYRRSPRGHRFCVYGQSVRFPDLLEFPEARPLQLPQPRVEWDLPRHAEVPPHLGRVRSDDVGSRRKPQELENQKDETKGVKPMSARVLTVKQRCRGLRCFI